MDEAELPEIKAVMVFTNDHVELDTENAPVPAMKLKQLKDFFRQKAKSKILPREKVEQISSALG